MQLCRYQWKLGSISLRGPARPLKCSLSSSPHRCPNLPAWDALQFRRYGSTKSDQEPTASDPSYGKNAEQATSRERRVMHKNSHLVQKNTESAAALSNGAWVSSAYALRKYLSLKTANGRAEYWVSIENKVQWTDLPIILLQYMHTTQQANSKDDFLQNRWSGKHLRDRWNAKLGALGFDIADLAHWAWIVAPESPDDVALRLVSTTKEVPIFLLFLVLRGEIQKVRTLKSLLVYVWDCVMGMARPDLRTSHPMGRIQLDGQEHRRIFQKHSIDEGAFNLLISTLLHHTRRLWPAAMLTVSNLIPPYILSAANTSPEQESMNAKSHARACNANNRFLRVFALPASINPLKSMSYNWAAQRVLLQLAGQSQPPLNLDKRSYEAVIQVLTALKKTDREAKVAALRARSWPPWRIDQDGMDAARSFEDDQSRAISAIIKSKEAGYGANLYDQTMSIFAGQEIDGTPTIHTRKQIKARSAHRQSTSKPSELDPLLWAARIEATRDVGEAWSAFVTFKERGGKPNQNVYLPMFQKIESESRRVGRGNLSLPSAGDGREVLPVSDDNFSEFYKKRFQPPALHQLYRQMIDAGFVPKGRCLNFLVRHARTLDEGFEYLRDSGIDDSTMALLVANPYSESTSASLEKVPLPVFASIIHLLCRFAPRAVPVAESGLSDSEVEHEANVKLDSQGRKWIIRKMRLQNLPYRSHPIDPLHQAAFLLTQRKPAYRPAWYALFKGLAGRHLLVSSDWEEAPNNDETAWKVNIAALGELQACGLELDPYGFLLICRTFEKYSKDYFGVLDGKLGEVRDASKIVKAEFEKLIEVVDAPDILPLFMHSIHGAHLHAYVRCMGLVNDHLEILSVLRWMGKYQEELDKVAAKSENGSRLLRHAVIAVRVFLDGTDYENEARELAEGIEAWGGWPTDDEVQLYIASDLGSKEGNHTEEDAGDDVEEGEDPVRAAQ